MLRIFIYKTQLYMEHPKPNQQFCEKICFEKNECVVSKNKLSRNNSGKEFRNSSNVLGSLWKYQ